MQKHKIIAAIVALPLAILLWLYVVTVVSPDSTRVIRDIPVDFEGTILLEERDLIMTSGGGSVSLKITGDRLNLQKLTNQNIHVVADLSRVSIYEPGEYSVPLSVSLPENAGKSNYDFVDKTKSEAIITVTGFVTKTVPVELDTGDEKVKDGFFFDSGNATAEPAEIVVSGPDFEIDQISRAVIDCTDVSELEETVVEQRPIMLLTPDGEEAELTMSTVGQTTATVSLPIQKYKELPLLVDIKDGGGATADNVDTLQYSADSILVRGGVSQIDNMEDQLVIGTIDLSKIIGINNKRTFTITLPNGIKNVNGIDEVEVTVKLTGLQTLSYMVLAENVELLNIPQNAEVQINTEKIAVKLRGPESDINQINAEDIHLSLDLSGVTKSGEILANVQIDSNPNVAVIEDVYVDIVMN